MSVPFRGVGAGYLPRDLYCLNSAYGSEGELRSLLQRMREHGVHAMADIVINHRVGSTQGVGGIYNRFDGTSMPWDEHAVTSDTGGLVKHDIIVALFFLFELCFQASQGSVCSSD